MDVKSTFGLCELKDDRRNSETHDRPDFRGVVYFAMVVGRLPFDVEMKNPVSNQKRRELFLEETKQGVKTMKHQSFMGATSFSE